ncbi:MAG TPA: YoaK family protein [Reyranella sp.]|nr:YoaK family protein [Reyranella sp.]
MLRAALQAGLLAAVAGIADAVGYLTMGHVFAANMTGNTVLAGIAAAQRDGMQAWHHLTPLLAFFAGAMLSRLLLRLTRSPKVPLVVEAILLAGVGFLPIGPEAAVLIVAVAMGVQASAITSFAGSAISTVVVTSTLARFADAALDRLWSGGAWTPPAIVNRRLLILTWSAYLAGAIIGTILVPAIPWPLLVPAGMLLLLLL